ncbi:MAG: serine hydrolase [Balneola sp.]|nr:serine hydrolase [Balneola sp.]
MKKILRTKFYLQISILFLGFCFFVNTELKSQSVERPDLNAIFQKADQIERVRTLIIHQKGETLEEKSFDGRNLSHPFNIKSASKSIIGLLTGIAIEKGFIPSIEEPIKTYFPDYFEENPDSLKESITIRNLLTMQTGLRSTSSGNYGAWVISDNWVEYALDQNFVSQIDGRMVYSTGTSHLLSVIISKASGIPTKAFAEKYLFGPMNIRVGGWDKDPQGNYMGGNNLALKPADLVKIGQLMLDDGAYNGEQLISKDWIRDSFGTYTYSNYNPYGYGYQWWNQKIGRYQTFFAWGNGGQYIFIIPELETVVVITSSTATTDRRRIYKAPIFDLVQFDIIPFLESRIN